MWVTPTHRFVAWIECKRKEGSLTAAASGELVFAIALKVLCVSSADSSAFQHRGFGFPIWICMGLCNGLGLLRILQLTNKQMSLLHSSTPDHPTRGHCHPTCKFSTVMYECAQLYIPQGYCLAIYSVSAVLFLLDSIQGVGHA